MKHILIVENLDLKILESYQNSGYTIDYKPSYSLAQIEDNISKYDAIIVGSHNISGEIISNWKNSTNKDHLAIVRAGSNTSTIDKKTAAEHNIVVMNTAGLNSASVAEFIIYRMINIYHQMHDQQSLRDVRNNTIKNRENYYHNYLYGKKLALIGTGFIGSKVSAIAAKLGLNVNAYSPNLSFEKAQQISANYCSTLEEALDQADIVSVQISYTTAGNNATYKLIDQQAISLLKNGATIINISRRDVIDCDALIAALKSQKVSFFSLDTIPGEIQELIATYPELNTMDNVFLTPSIATASNELKVKLTEEVLQRIFLYWQENKIIDRVN